jgi:serine/threonine protein kinase
LLTFLAPQRGDIKIFDFGLAKENPGEDADEDYELFHLIWMCGSMRYMPSKVALQDNYDDNK